MILHYLDASSIGGIETHVENVAGAQNAAGAHAAVILHRRYPGSPVENRYRSAGLEVFVAGGVAGLLRTMRTIRPSILHTHGYKAGIAGRFAALATGVPCVSTFHAGERGAGRVALYQAIDSWTSFLAPRIAVSQAIADALPFRAEVVRNFVTPAPAMRRTPLNRRLVFAGRLSHEKGPDLFCRLAAAIPDRSVQWDMYGDGPMRDRLEADHAHRVAFHGFTNAMGAVLEKASALVMTSRNEGLPMVALEAMAKGVPVIAPRVGGLPDLIEDGVDGFLFDVEDEAAMRMAVGRFCSLDKGAVEQMGFAARSKIEAGYSPRAILPRLAAIYARAGWRGEASTSTNVQSSAG